MAEARLKTALWVSAVLRQAAQGGRSAMRLRRGDEDAGGVLAVLVDRDGRSVVLTQTRNRDGELAWMRGTGADPVTAADADAYVSRQVGRDPDLWVLEFDTDDLMPPFEATILSA